MDAGIHETWVVVVLGRLVGLAISWCILPEDYRRTVLRHQKSICACLWFFLSDSSPRSSRTANRRHLKKSKKERRVSFGQLEILEFPSILGDSPSVTNGAPVILGHWAVRKSVVSVDEWTEEDEYKAKPRPMPPKDREALLLSKGYNLAEIEEAAALSGRKRRPRLSSTRSPTSLKAKIRAIIARRGSFA